VPGKSGTRQWLKWRGKRSGHASRPVAFNSACSRLISQGVSIGRPVVPGSILKHHHTQLQLQQPLDQTHRSITHPPPLNTPNPAAPRQSSVSVATLKSERQAVADAHPINAPHSLGVAPRHVAPEPNLTSSRPRPASAVASGAGLRNWSASNGR